MPISNGVPPLTMLRHAIPEATSLRQTDTNLGPTAAVHIARLFRSQSSTILAMTTSGFPQSAARLVAPRVIQCCIACSEQNRLRGAATAVQRSWIEGWRITFPVCRQRQQETREGTSAVASTSSPFEDLWVNAVHGEEIIDQSLGGASVGGVSPIDIARLLLIRRCPKPSRHQASNATPPSLAPSFKVSMSLWPNRVSQDLRLQDPSCLSDFAWRCSLVSQSAIRQGPR